MGRSNDCGLEATSNCEKIKLSRLRGDQCLLTRCWGRCGRRRRQMERIDCWRTNHDRADLGGDWAGCAASIRTLCQGVPRGLPSACLPALSLYAVCGLLFVSSNATALGPRTSIRKRQSLLRAPATAPTHQRPLLAGLNPCPHPPLSLPGGHGEQGGAPSGYGVLGLGLGALEPQSLGGAGTLAEPLQVDIAGRPERRQCARLNT